MGEVSKENGKKVCVTGASGYIASWLVKLLLQRGYIVHATVRDLDEPTKTEHLKALEGATERLDLFKANLMEEGSFDAAIDGCEGVFHTASPVVFSPKDPQMCYVLSKVLAEEAAWKFVKENEMDMVSINPSMTIGPMLQPTLNDSVASILNLINGTEFYPDLACPWVHVKDVAEAHIRAFEIPSANGRYILGERVLHFSDVLKILHELYPSLKLPNKIVDVSPLPNTRYQVSNTKVRSLGIEYIPFEVSLKETVQSLKEKKFVQCESTTT